MTPHNEADINQIAKNVIMVGDPLRAKLIADTYLENYEIVSKVRGNNVYTGSYKGHKITIMASGMGMPSMGIYAYELFKFYNVDSIIRVGTCGSYDKNLNLFDIILTKRTFSESNFGLTLDNKKEEVVYPSLLLNKTVKEIAFENNINIIEGDIVCTDSFYMDDVNKYFERIPTDFSPKAVEMESYALFYLANKFQKNAACILTVSDIIGTNIETTPEEREKGLKKAIELALGTMERL